ncbi:MAG: hypothetical protein HKN01_01525 [Acidimicrobiia bacterium]|nr:hypothetical protein [Acidimicrobiia bacterium]
MQSFPTRRPVDADSYIYAHRRGAVRSIQRRGWAMGRTEEEALDLWQEATTSTQEFLASCGKPTLTVDYRHVVDDVDAVIERIADFLGIEPWQFTAWTIFDGDEE